ncbi:SSCRP protein [Diplogelasinospora grovesii]|uniref:SSCRP protein n=1 Tax=Diplogelasinospora grovesii TaxID=303347 RepID=A0AAN6N6T3_9PEZI|nr:SSCRP protein [Diplogelasinospora grovesii]
MKAFTIIAFVAATVLALPNGEVPVAGLNERTDGSNGCNSNNCARAVTGTRAGKKPDVTSRQSDCSTFMTTTVTIDDWGHPIATITNCEVPAYATACDNPNPTAAYSSACSCWGITAGTTTVC